MIERDTASVQKRNGHGSMQDQLFSAFPKPSPKPVLEFVQRVEKIEPVSQTHKVYLHIQTHAGIHEDMLVKEMKAVGLSVRTVTSALETLFAQGVVTRVTTGKFNQRGREIFAFRINNKEYIPRPSPVVSASKVRSKIKRSAESSVRTLPVSPAQQKLMDQLAKLNGQIEHVQATTSPEVLTAQHVIDEVEAMRKLMPKDESGNPKIKPIVGIPIEIGNQSMFLSVEEAKHLYLELSLIFKAQLGF